MTTKLKKLFVMRHAESLEDIDKTAYERVADEDMPLSDHGRDEAMAFGREFAQNLGLIKRIQLILSPSKRVLETANLIVSCMPPGIKWSLATEHLIEKQHWGNVTTQNRSQIERDRYREGVLRYKFPGGESGAEYLSRFDLFARRLKHTMDEQDDDLFLVITHGFELRVLLKSLLEWSEDYFEMLAHPLHCEIKRLTYENDRITLLDEMRTYNPSLNPNFIRRQTT